MEPRENKDCYAKPILRRLLGEIAPIADDFFLTGGTALSVFYLHHRLSEDLDFFSRRKGVVESIVKHLQRKWPNSTLQKQTDDFATLLIDDVKIDLVESINELNMERPIVEINGAKVLIDDVRNIYSNKLTTLIGRCDPKDITDFYFLEKAGIFSRDLILSEATEKEGSLDDMANAAYMIEMNLSRAQKISTWPEMLVPFDRQEAIRTVQAWVRWLYELGNPYTSDPG